MVKGYLIYWPSSHVQNTWEILRPCLQIISVKGNWKLSSTRKIGIKPLVQSWELKLITAGSIISISSIPSNEQIIEYIYLGYIYMHLTALFLRWVYASYAYHV